MDRQMTKAEARAWMERWKRVNDFEREELRATSIDTKFRQLAAMMRMARSLGWDAESQDDVSRVRALWVRLKKGAARDAR